MKRIWTRAMSLTLSVLMVLGSLPMTALAQEEEDSTLYPVWVDGQQLTADTHIDGLDYDPDRNTLYLEDLTLDTLKLGQAMTIDLSGDNAIESTNAEVALAAEEELDIEGTGSLTVRSDGETAMTVAGWQQEDVRYGLTVSGSVTLVVQSLTSPNGVTFGNGTHVSVGQSANGEFYIFSGYAKIGSGDMTSGSNGWTADGSALTFVGENHLEWQQEQEGHYRTCADENCPLAEGLRLDAGEHHTTREANCKQAAYCEDCGEYGEQNSLLHANATPEEAFNETEHWQQFACCGTEVPDSRGSHDLTTQTEESAVISRCEHCAYNKRAGLRKAEDTSYTYDGTAKAVEAVNELDGTALSISYYDRDGHELDGAPIAAGTYQARTTYGEAVLKLEYTIDGQPLEDAMVTLTPEQNVYGEATDVPILTVQKGITCSVTYARDGREPVEPEEMDWEQAGTITITVTGTGNYTGTVTKTYTIRQAEPKAELFCFTPPTDLTYDGKKKEAALIPEEGVAGLGDFTVAYDAEPVHAGTYSVSAAVAGNGNYAEKSVTTKEWQFTIQPTNQYTNVTQTRQYYGNGIGSFPTPAFTGVDGETVPGTGIFTVDDSQISETILKEKLDKLADGESLSIGYLFTPKQGGDYVGEKSGTIQVTKVQLTFAMEDGTAITDAAIRRQGTITYGDTDILDLTHLTATAGVVTDRDASHFTVKYTQDNGQTLLDEPGVGTYQYIVYYSNPDLGGIAVTNAVVFSGQVIVTKPLRGSTTLIRPTAEPLVEKENSIAQPLLTEKNKGSGYEYCFERNGTYSTEVPTGDKPGKYVIWYREAGTNNTPEKLTVIIYPYLTATYGETMGDLKLPEGFRLNETHNPPSTSVGEAGDRSVWLDYDTVTFDGVEVPLTVKKKPITVTFAIADKDRFMSYKKGTSVKPEIAEVKEGAEVWNVTDDCALPKKEYTWSYEGDTGRGKAKVWPASTGNYDFTAEPIYYCIYDLKAAQLLDDAKLSDAVKQAGFTNGKLLREKLSAQFPDGYPEARRKYTYFIMNHGDGQYDYSSEDFPTDGVTMRINYPNDTDKNDAFKVYGMYLADDGDNKAGTVVELKKATDAPKLGEYACYDNGIGLNMPTYMAVAIGAEAEKYTLKRTSSTLGTITFTAGEDTTAQISAKVRAGEKVTVSITGIKEKYAVSAVEYYETALGYQSSDPKKASKNGDGTYSFDMPENDTTIKVTIKKSSGNPTTGDGIGLWVATLLLSGTGAGCLLGRRKKKR